MTSPSNPGLADRQAGFTLIEMIVVIAIMGLAMLLIAGFGPPRDRWLETQAAARQVAQAMRAAQGSAVARDQPAALVMPPLPAWLGVAIQAPPGGIVFAPDGSASGGRVLLHGAGRELAVSADWLTGQVRIGAANAP